MSDNIDQNGIVPAENPPPVVTTMPLVEVVPSPSVDQPVAQCVVPLFAYISNSEHQTATVAGQDVPIATTVATSPQQHVVIHGRPSTPVISRIPGTNQLLVPRGKTVLSPRPLNSVPVQISAQNAVRPFGSLSQGTRTFAYLVPHKVNREDGGQVSQQVILAPAAQQLTTVPQASIILPMAQVATNTSRIASKPQFINLTISNRKIQTHGTVNEAPVTLNAGSIATACNLADFVPDDTQPEATVEEVTTESTEKQTEECMSPSELDRRLQEVVDEIFADNSIIDDEKVDANDEDLPPVLERQPSISTNYDSFAQSEYMDDSAPVPDLEPIIETHPMDVCTQPMDVCTQPAVSPEIKKENSTADGDNFDPVKALDWVGEIGSLPGSNLKFRMNDLGIMEMVDEEERLRDAASAAINKGEQFIKEETNSQEQNIEMTVAPVEGKDNCVSEEKLKEELCTSVITIKCEPSAGESSILTATKQEPVALDTTEENVRTRECTVVVLQADTPASVPETTKVTVVNPKTRPHQGKERKTTIKHSADDIYCCEGCGCYGLASEFVNQHFCSHHCITIYATRKAAMLRKNQESKQKVKRAAKAVAHAKTQSVKRTHKDRKQAIPAVAEEELEHQPSSPAAQSVSLDGIFPPDEEIAGEAVGSFSELYGTVGKMPWQFGKMGFSWAKYLEHHKALAAPQKLFRDPFPYTKNGFRTGMKLEGIDPEHQSMFCVLTVAEIHGYRVRLHFDGYPFCHDFWVNADSPDIFPVGWCEKNGHILQPPRGHPEHAFNWNMYLKQCRAQPAPRHLFVNRSGSVCPSGFRIGMKLEAVDKKNSSLICVATIADIMDSRILVHFDSWDDIYDYWADPTSPYIHPVGWCSENGYGLTPPNGYQDCEKFDWDEYLRETKTVPAPVRAFKQRPASGFRSGMKLECVDRRNPSLIRAATIASVRNHELLIHFDGWPHAYNYWIDEDSPDIHPVGWCYKSGHRLQPPLTEDDMEAVGKNNSCPTPVCNGYGHIKGPKYTSHSSASSCPYSEQNMNNDNLIPDRIHGKFEAEDPSSKDHEELYLGMETSCDSHEMVPVTVPQERHPEDVASLSEEEIIDAIPVRKKKRKKRLLNGHGPGSGCQSLSPPKKPHLTASENSIPVNEEVLPQVESLRQQIHSSVFCLGSESTPYKHKPLPWLRPTCCCVRAEDVLSWKVADVVAYIENIRGCRNVAPKFGEEAIDGPALLLLSRTDMIKSMKIKLGPAMKIFNSIASFHQRQIGRDSCLKS